MLEKTSPSLWGNDQNIYNKNSRNWNLLRCTNAKKIAPGTPNNQLKWMFGETTISILLPVTLEELFRPFCSLSDEITGPRWWRENRMFIHFLFYLCLLKNACRGRLTIYYRSILQNAARMYSTWKSMLKWGHLAENLIPHLPAHCLSAKGSIPFSLPTLLHRTPTWSSFSCLSLQSRSIL